MVIGDDDVGHQRVQCAYPITALSLYDLRRRRESEDACRGTHTSIHHRCELQIILVERLLTSRTAAPSSARASTTAASTTRLVRLHGSGGAGPGVSASIRQVVRVADDASVVVTAQLSNGAPSFPPPAGAFLGRVGFLAVREFGP